MRREGAFGKSHPLMVKALSGDVYRVTDWGGDDDIRTALKRQHPSLAGEEFTFLTEDGSAEIDSTSVINC